MLKRIILAGMLLLMLGGCVKTSPEPEIPPVTAIPTLASTVPPTEPPTQLPTEPPHSSLYLPDVPVEDVIQYFNEVCLNAEFVDSGDPSYLQRWNMPISYCIYGAPTQEDREKIQAFSQWLNRIDSFPGMYEVGEDDYVNLRIYFCDESELIDRMGEQFYGTDGAVTFWYVDDAIYDAVICIRTDLDQELRNSVILEEIYNGLGPIQDTALRPDSIIYSEFSMPQALTEMDELILKLLYHPELSCGMDASECEAVIRSLYY